MYTGIIDRFHEGVPIVKEIGTPGNQTFDHLEMSLQRFIDQSTKVFPVMSQ